MTASDILDRLHVSAGVIGDFCRRWSITEFAVFGSAARDEMRPDSDVDVMVEFVPGARWSLLDIGGMQQELVDLFGRSFDLVEKGPIENPFKRFAILRDLTVICAA